MPPVHTLVAVLRRRPPERQRPTVVLPDRLAPGSRQLSHAEALVVAGRQLVEELWDEQAPRAVSPTVPAPRAMIDLRTDLPT